MTLRNDVGYAELVATGTNEFIVVDPATLKLAVHRLFAKRWKRGVISEMWDGSIGERIVTNLEMLLC